MDDSKVKALVERLAEAVRQSIGEGEITLSTDARAYWNVKYHEVSKDEQGVLGSVTARSEAYVMRLSLLFCLLDCLSTIEQRHIEAACHLVEFCRKSVQYIFTVPSLETGTDADKLLNALAEKDMSQTEISNLFNGHKKRTELMALLNELQTMNKIKQLPKETGSKKIMWSIIKL
jgi:DNA replicative helicase MCM subunit Mcm2 (Cdc46/Mcm family)